MKEFRNQLTAPNALIYLPWGLGILVCLGLFNGALNHGGNTLDGLLSTCNLRLLDSVRSWSELGFWQLGGLMSFRSSLLPLSPPTQLYSSQSTLYVVPHLYAYQLGGVAGFFQMVRASVFCTAGAMAAVVGILSWLLTEERLHQVRAPRFLLGFILFAAFAVTFPSEGVWGGLWNSDDRALSSVLLALASATLALGLRSQRAFWHWLSAVLLVSGAIGCPRMGVISALTVLIGRYGLPRRDAAVRAIFSWPMTLALLGFSALHYVRVGLVDLTGRYVLDGSSILNRFGFSHEMRGKGQSDLNYESIVQAFGFVWRQSELMIGKLPWHMQLEHLLLYLLAAGGLFILFRHLYLLQSPYLAPVTLVTAPPLIWGVLINQSVAEHPDVHAITWVVPISLGLVIVLEKLMEALFQRFGVFWSVVIGTWFTYWCFLWQVQYFLRAYPGLRFPYPN